MRHPRGDLFRASATRLIALAAAMAGWPAWPQQPAALPITIDQAVTQALEHNLALLARRYDVSIAEAGLITARLRPNPVISVGADHLDWLGTGYDEINAAGPPEYNWRTDFVIERGGKRERRIEVARGNIEVARLNVLNAAREIVLEVQNAFVDLLRAKQELEIARNSLDALNAIVEINAVRVRSGDLAEVELMRSRVAALQFRNEVRQAELRVLAARNTLQLLLGRTGAGAPLEIAGDQRLDAGPPSSAAVLRQAREARPDLVALRREQARSQSELRLQLAQGRVDYVIGAEYRRQQGLAGRGNSLGLFFETNLPVFNRNQGEVARVREEQRQIEARVRELEAAIALQVENAFEQFSTARELLGSIERDMLTQATEVRDVTEYSYKRGEASLVEFLDAQRAFNETMQAHSEARAEYARSLYLLESAAGVLPAAAERVVR